MGPTSFINKAKSSGYKNKSGSSIGSDKEMNGKLRRQKIRRPSKMTDYGLKRMPDYTEMAYKEAVSKLRYFFSGNYAPSVRSFGSPSIKNLDETDGDIDKKYHTTALAEYKPRPRLTAKYTTLYADSLNNATQPRNINVAAPAPAADLSGGTNPDVINFIQKQEEYIEQLERESQYCRDELNNLLGKVKEVISENENLHEAQKNKIISRMFHSYNAGSETDELDDLGDSTGLDSDNKATPSKGRRSAKPRSSRLEGPNIVFESRISELEAQLAQAKIDNKKIQDENNENKRKLASGLVDSTCLDGFKRQIDNLQRDKSSLESQIAKLKMSLEQRELSELDGRQSRSDHELQLRDQRDRLEDEVRRLKEDLATERSKSRELYGEGARRVLQERSAAEQRYTAHCDQLQRDLAAQYDNLAKMQLEMERQRREENDLKREISMKNAAIEDLKMDIKNKTSSLQADLAQAYAEKASLEEELASARLSIERQQRQAKHETNRLNSEIQSLRQRLDRADADVVHARRENLRLTEQVANLEKEINMKTLTPFSPENKKNEKEISSMLETMDNKHAKTVAELESMIHSQNSLMEKLTGECRLLTDKLDDANRRHKEQLATLHRQVDYLTVSLQSTQNAPNAYEAPTSHQTTTDRTVPHTSTTGRDYTGSDATGYSQIGDQPHTNIPDVRKDGRDDNDYVPSRRVSKQNSRTSLLSQETIANDTKPYETTNITPANYLEESASQEHNIQDNDYTEKEYKDQHEKEKIVDNSEYEHQNYGDQEYTQHASDAQYTTQPEYQEPAATETAYQNQEYDQPAYTQQEDYPQNLQEYTQEQPKYTEEPQEYAQEPQEFAQHQQGYETEQTGYTQEQYENYEQYPQQYADPNAQYDPQAYAQNYAADPNYDQSQYDQTNYVDETQVQPQTEATKIESPEKPKVFQEKIVKSDVVGPGAGRNGKSSPPKGKVPSKS